MANGKQNHIKQRTVTQMGGKCKRCGYNESLASLCFHHIDPSTKLYQISECFSRREEVLQTELAKCVMLCQNCHHALHNSDWSISELD
jgi:hypothetical protein